MDDASQEYKIKSVAGGSSRSAFRMYRDLYYGDTGLGHVLLCELITTLFAGVPGALGLALRKAFYPMMFKQSGRGVVFGRNLTLRHAHKIVLGDKVILDDGVVLDAKGATNRGITVGDRVYIGRNTIVYTKNGDIELGDEVNLSSNCQVFSSNALSIGAHTVIGAFTYLLSGGEYDTHDPTPFSQQSGMNTRGPLTIGPGCWLGAGITVTDASSIGERCVIGAGAVVCAPIPARSIAMGVPAKVRRTMEQPHDESQTQLD